MRKRERRAPDFDGVLEQLRDESTPLPFGAIEALSDLDSNQMAALRPVLAQMTVERRRLLIETLADMNETEFEFDFDQVMVVALDDADSQVRAVAVDGIMYDVSMPVIEHVRQMARSDGAVEVRARAVSKLGHFILLGEYEEIPEAISRRLQDTALALYRNPAEPVDVRRRALEAFANCEREEVEGMIRESYQSPDLMMRVSAVFAMGRTCDEVWAPDILAELSSPHPEMLYEAARAAGDLELQRAVPYLIEFAQGDDREIQLVAVWSLGEIGGERAESALDRLAERAEARGDEDLLEAIDEAHGSLLLVKGDESMLLEAMDGMLPMFDLGGLAHHAHDDDDNDEEFDEFDEERDDDDENDDENDDLIEDDEEFDSDFGELPGFRTFTIEDALSETLDDEDDLDLDDLEGAEDDDQI